jgi:enoyl-CoA hydratase/carnithine racemase
MTAGWLPDLRSAVAEASGRTVRVDLVDAAAEIVLARSDKLNAINTAVLRGIRTALAGCADRREVRAVIVRGEGRCFSAGGDLAEVRGLVRDSAAFDEFLDFWHAGLALVERSPLPSIAAVHGFAFAGGFELMQVCDFAVAGDRTRIGDQHAKFGLFPAGGSAQRLPRQAGPRAAKWLLMTGEAVSAADALTLGLVNRVVAEDEVLHEARRMAATLAGRSRHATAAIKQAVRLGQDRNLTEAIALERPITLRHMASDDAQIGFAAFETRTEPEFP